LCTCPAKFRLSTSNSLRTKQSLAFIKLNKLTFRGTAAGFTNSYSRILYNLFSEIKSATRACDLVILTYIYIYIYIIMEFCCTLYIPQHIFHTFTCNTFSYSRNSDANI
jgi:hypothetical protein